jgi:TPR repeat protein
MTKKRKLQGIISLSSASLALLQSTVSANGDQSDKSSIDLNNALKERVAAKTDQLTLAPVHHEELIRLYAAHSSHASHSSHVSGTSGSYDSTPSVPVAPAVTQPTYVQPQSTDEPPLTPEQIEAAKAKVAADKKASGEKALKYNQKLADEGDPYGLLRMGERYRDGDGVPKDLAQARDYFTKAVAAGSPTAADELSQLGQPVIPKPKTNSVTQAEASESSTSRANALTNTVAGEATTDDTGIVTFLKTRAAEGSADAQFALADYYIKGRDGVKQDVEKAKLLLEMSASQGNTYARERLEELQKGSKNTGKSDK